jgi:hypothetical protein
MIIGGDQDGIALRLDNEPGAPSPRPTYLDFQLDGCLLYPLDRVGRLVRALIRPNGSVRPGRTFAGV